MFVEERETILGESASLVSVWKIVVGGKMYAYSLHT